MVDGVAIRHDIYPARGRKLSNLDVIDYVIYDESIRHDIYPARGRKPDLGLASLHYQQQYSPRYLPRKGTETPLNED